MLLISFSQMQMAAEPECESLALECLVDRTIRMDYDISGDEEMIELRLTQHAFDICQGEQFKKSGKPRKTLMRLIAALFPSPNLTTSVISELGVQISAKEFYRLTDNLKISAETSPPKWKNPPNLIPTLRPYQASAVNWMLRRESRDSPRSTTWKMLWMEIPTQPAPLFLNPFLNVVVSDRKDTELYVDECLKEGGRVPEVKGGILAEQMGLGKTVEVLALILKNPIPKNTATPKICTSSYTPPVIRDHKIDISAVCICGNLTAKGTQEIMVLCSRCGDWNHSLCVGFTHPQNVVGGECNPNSQCFTCIAEACHKIPIKSRATLIVTPPALTKQWLAEIHKHTKNLKCCVYDGVKEISAKAGNDLSLLNPINLADHDIILTTFGTLQADLGHSDKNPYSSASGRREARVKRKKYRVFPSPLTSIKFWRICIDEAQKIASPTAKSAEMALRLHGENFWAVSGTPVARNKLSDIYGLMIFLDQRPWSNFHTFKTFFNTNHADFDNRIVKVFGEGCMWRSTKTNPLVKQQLNIPDQSETTHVVNFAPVEKAVYTKHFQEIQGEVRQLLRGGARSGDFEKVANLIQRLRATCSHPTVGSHGMQRGQRKAAPKAGQKDKGEEKQDKNKCQMSMIDIAERLMEDAALACVEDQQTIVFHGNAAAAMLRLQYQYNSDPSSYHREKIGDKFIDPPPLSKPRILAFLQDAIDSYLSSLDLINSNLPFFKPDRLQKIHILHNLVLNVQMHPKRETLDQDKVKRWEADVDDMRSQFMGGRIMSWGSTHVSLRRVKEKFTKQVTEYEAVKSDATFNWWDQLINYVEAHDKLVPRGEQGKKHLLAPVLIKYVNEKMAHMLAHAAGGIFMTSGGVTKVGANKRQKNVNRQNLEARLAAGDHDNLPQEYADIMDLVAQLSSYISTFSVVQRYTQLTGDEITSVEGLVNPPPDFDVAENGECKECKSELRMKGPVCRHCTLKTQLNLRKAKLNDHKFLTTLGAVQDFLKSLHSGQGALASGYTCYDDENGKEKEKRGTAADPVLATYVELADLPRLGRLVKEAETFVGCVKHAKLAMEAVLAHWESHQNLMGGLNELSQCVSTAR